ncbi:uncharacterized protein LOC117114749 [Anneissia japonica]|uniref:uncharacterized protein LOC117114749 n=1 Tax=Anneissia japonica TaxID=1529436 RepID=UPI001425B982|nr:uncharacterized protein LOC117114749 [Anneissia japonica]
MFLFSDELRYVPSNLNPADALTKPMLPSELQEWIRGPEFLRQNRESWPCCEPDYDTEAKRRIVKEFAPDALRKINCVSTLQETFEERLCSSTSDWNLLFRRIAYCRRFLIKKECRPKSFALTLVEIQQAEHALFYVSQSFWAENETDVLTTRKFNPKIDRKALVRVEGRLRKLKIPEEQKCPVLLRRGSLLAHLLSHHIHRSCGHQGYRVAVAYAFKQGIYILGGAKLFKEVAAECLYCRTRRRYLLTQQMGERKVDSERIKCCKRKTNTQNVLDSYSRRTGTCFSF